MTPAERTARITELRAEADWLEREGKRNWPGTVEKGDLFQHNEGAIYIFPSRDCDDLFCVIGDDVDKPGDYYSRDLFRSEPQRFAYIGRDLLTIKTPDAPEVDVGAGYVAIPWQNADEGDEYMIDGKWWKSGGGSTHPRVSAVYLWRRKADAPEPIGAELVGEYCEYCGDKMDWDQWGKGECASFDPSDITPYKRKGDGTRFRHARLYRGDRP